MPLLPISVLPFSVSLQRSSQKLQGEEQRDTRRSKCQSSFESHSTSTVNLFLSIDYVEEAVLGILVLIIDHLQVNVILHQVLSSSEKHHALVFITINLEFLPDYGEDLTNLEGVRHQESIQKLTLVVII